MNPKKISLTAESYRILDILRREFKEDFRKNEQLQEQLAIKQEYYIGECEKNLTLIEENRSLTETLQETTGDNTILTQELDQSIAVIEEMATEVRAQNRLIINLKSEIHQLKRKVEWSEFLRIRDSKFCTCNPFKKTKRNLLKDFNQSLSE